MVDLERMGLIELQQLQSKLDVLAKVGAILEKAGIAPVFSMAPGQPLRIETSLVLINGLHIDWRILDSTLETALPGGIYLTPTPSGPLSDPAFLDTLAGDLADLAMPAPETPQSPPPVVPAAHGLGIDAPPAGARPAAGGAASEPEDIPSPQLVVSSPTGLGGGAPPAGCEGPAGGEPQPKVPDLGEAQDPILRHWMTLPDAGWTPEQDRELMELICAGWRYPELSVELRREKKALQTRFDQLTGQYQDDKTGKLERLFTRDAVLAALILAVPSQAA